MCNPFGRSDPDSLINFGSDDIAEHNYIFFFDQEPIHLNIHAATFDEAVRLNADLYAYYTDFRVEGSPGAICTSECDSEVVEELCRRYNWTSYYYFFHGWAALDWYRGYDRTFLMPNWQDRKIQYTFIAPNRIIAGERQHRLKMLYWIFKLGLENNHISCPTVCPAENISIYQAVESLSLQYPDIKQIFDQANLPRQFAGETDHPMHSCWLSLFDESAESLLYLVTETVATGRRHQLTEKTFKPIALGMPFVIVGTQGSLKYLRRYGFQTFGDLWDESYDDEPDDEIRIQKIAQVLATLDQLSVDEKNKLFVRAHSIIEHNWNHFYHGGFEQVLWDELTGMLNAIKFNC